MRLTDGLFRRWVWEQELESEEQDEELMQSYPEPKERQCAPPACLLTCNTPHSLQTQRMTSLDLATAYMGRWRFVTAEIAHACAWSCTAARTVTS